MPSAQSSSARPTCPQATTPSRNLRPVISFHFLSNRRHPAGLPNRTLSRFPSRLTAAIPLSCPPSPHASPSCRRRRRRPSYTVEVDAAMGCLAIPKISRLPAHR
ncbi:hypothetical protein GUJ93_ZPchr0008g11689 [Zizania palustris]|uniref:Uncharacterized protein n=1 Tax=Zizania palustris TaxID=103762 RepID=A0A8J5V0P8_ZIZPA|nr:hypothetical protein GUJ93_ZPchr0008g11689 [Zizania palustris]